MDRPSMKDIAQRVGVSRTIVSRVLNNKSSEFHISDKTKNKILKVANQLKYRPNLLALGLRMGRTHIIGFIVSDISNPFFSHIARSVEEAASMYGYHVIFCNSNENREKELYYIQALKDRMVDGLIIATADVKGKEIRLLKQEGYPFVLIDRRANSTKTNYVGVDNTTGTLNATSHLIKAGHRRIAYIGGPLTYSNLRERYNGYKKALEKSGLKLSREIINLVPFTEEGGYKAAGEILGLKNKPSAILIANNMLTIGVLRYIKEKKMCIPEDIAVVGFDELGFSTLLDAPLTVVAQPEEKIGKIAVKILLEDIKQKARTKRARQVILPVRFIVRKSCGKWGRNSF